MGVGASIEPCAVGTLAGQHDVRADRLVVMMDTALQRRRRWQRGATAVCGAIVLAVSSGLSTFAQTAPSKPDTSRSEVETIEIVAQPLSGFEKLNGTRTSFGKLEWLGGLVLSSSDKRFGGWSGLAMDADGQRLVAVSDAGTWMSSDVVYRGGRIAGLTNATLGPIKARDGGRLKRDKDRDAEAVLLLGGTLKRGKLLIAFEQNHRLGYFDIDGNGVSPPSRYLAVPAEARRMRPLKGFEAVAEIKGGRHKGALIAFAEHLLDGKGNHSGWLLARGRSSVVSLTDIGGFDPTDAIGLDNGDIIVLERRFRWLEGVKMRLRLIRASEIAAGAVLAGEVLLEADMADEIDNMEALSAHRAADGGTVLSIMSDDNFNGFLQRTLLLQFKLKDDGVMTRVSR